MDQQEFLGGPLRRLALAVVAASVTAQAAGAAAPIREDWEKAGSASLSYGQSGTVWSTMDKLDRAHKNFVALGRVVDPQYGSFEEAFSRLAMSIGGKRGWSLEVSGEAIGMGRVSNPVLPELKVNALMIGMAKGALNGVSGPWSFGGGLVVGFGPEQRSDAVSTDLIDEIEMREGMLALIGADFEAGRKWELQGGWRLGFRGLIQESLFLSGTEGAPLDFGTEGEFWAHRWRIRSEVSRTLSGWGELGVQCVLGPQPLPVDVIPRTWDYVHRIQPLAELGTLVGGGIRWSGGDRQWRDWTIHSGFYAGYFGLGVIYRGRPWELAFGSWGIEGSTAYRGLGQRIWQAKLGVRI